MTISARFSLCLATSVTAALFVGCAPAPESVDIDPTEEAPTMETSHTLEEVAPGVYFASSEGKGDMVLMSNAMVVVNDDDVLVVDSHVTAEAGRSLLAAVRTVSDKPVHYLVNTHYHFDHAHGNQSFGENVEIIGHEYTREKMLGPVLEETTYQTIGHPDAVGGVIAGLEAQLESADEATRAALEAQIAMWTRHQKALPEVQPTPPELTITEKMSIHRGSREIQVLHLGRGHTGGDVVVYLPNEKIVFTGDLFYAGAPYLGDGFADEFPDTLERLKELDIELIVPGHGPLVRDKAQIDVTINYLRDYWSQVRRSHRQGKSVDQAVDALDLSQYAEYAAFNINTPGVLALEVARMYQRLDAQ